MPAGVLAYQLTLSAPTPQNGQTLKQFVGILSTSCVSVFDHFVGFVLKRLIPSDNAFK